MKTEELLRYQAEYKAMQETFGKSLLVFDFPKQVNSLGEYTLKSWEKVGMPRSLLRDTLLERRNAMRQRVKKDKKGRSSAPS